jgi:hypothetical protein
MKKPEIMAVLAITTGLSDLVRVRCKQFAYTGHGFNLRLLVVIQFYDLKYDFVVGLLL